MFFCYKHCEASLLVVNRPEPPAALINLSWLVSDNGKSLQVLAMTCSNPFLARRKWLEAVSYQPIKTTFWTGQDKWPSKISTITAILHSGSWFCSQHPWPIHVLMDPWVAELVEPCEITPEMLLRQRRLHYRLYYEWRVTNLHINCICMHVVFFFNQSAWP